MVAFIALSLGDLTKVIYCIVSQSDYEVSVIIYRYRFNAYAGIAFFSCYFSEIKYRVIGQSNDQFSVFVNDNGFYTDSGVTCIALYICHYDSKEYIAVYSKCYFVFVCFGKQFAADVPALENKGRVKCHGCCKLCSLKELIAARDFFFTVFNRKDTALNSCGECNRIFRYLLDFYRDICICLDSTCLIGITAVVVVDPRSRVCKAVVFIRLYCNGDLISVANGITAYKIFVSVFNSHIGILDTVYCNSILLDFGEIHLNVGFGIHNDFIVVLTVQLIICRYGVDLVVTGNDELLHSVIFCRLCGKNNFCADNNTRTRLITLLSCHCACLIAACGRIGQRQTDRNIKFCTDLSVLCNSHSEAFAALTLGVACPCTELAVCVSFDSECQFTINRNIHAVVVIQFYNIAVCIGDLYCTALCGDIYLYLLADLGKRSKFCFNSVFFRCQSQRIGV